MDADVDASASDAGRDATTMDAMLPPDDAGPDAGSDAAACDPPLLVCGADCIDPTSDTLHCGTCDPCPTPPSTIATCVDSVCGATCVSGFADCDMDPANGCEIDTARDVAHCGTCTMACGARFGVTPGCSAGVCTYACAGGLFDCDGIEANGCEVDPRADPLHCGGCDPCAAHPGAIASCAASTCGYACDAAHLDCNGDITTDGCEVSALDIANCGTCGRDCRTAAPGGTTPTCAATGCAFPCDASHLDCDGVATNGCEVAPAADPLHCGGCTACAARPNAAVDCTAGLCTFTCLAGFGDCDGNTVNGCETATTTSSANCGACGAACGPAETCTGGSCHCGTGPAGSVGGGQACTGATPDCCRNACVVAATTVCRPSAGACDLPEMCTGTAVECPPDALAAAGTTCRASTGVCDAAETCSGTGVNCPADGFAAAGTTCRSSADACDVAETCTGASAACPADGVAAAGTECRATAGICDVAETCNGGTTSCPADGFHPAGDSCPGGFCNGSGAMCDTSCVVGAACSTGNPCEIGALTCPGGVPTCVSAGPQPAGTVCRASAGVCDVAEACTGASTTCPVDAFTAAGTACRISAGGCDVPETCTGTSAACPADGFMAAGAVCRTSAGVCDAVETCTGAGAACPADAFAAAGTSCRAAAGICDVVEACTGAGAACPADVFVPAGTACRASAGVCDVAEACTGGSAVCPADGFVVTGTVCRAPAGTCDVAEACSGADAACPADGFAAAGTLCRGLGDLCDAAESCSGASALCPVDTFAPAGTLCRGLGGLCDVTETCSGASSACPADAFAAAGMVCRASAGVCDVVEACSGADAACPANAFAPPTTGCRASAGVCDVAENCSGVAAACPVNGFVAAGTSCRASAGPCDVVETCTGAAAACPSDAFAMAGTVCRAATSTCDVAETCSGAVVTCPADALQPDGTGCSDGVFCTSPDTCTAGVCGGPARVCADAMFCNGVETCSEAMGACVAGAAPCTADAYTCTITCDEPTDTCNLRSEPLCGATQICNPVEYPGGGSGCGNAPNVFNVTCPATGSSGAASTCTMTLRNGGTGIDGEASRIACVAAPMPATMFVDDFNDGTLDAPWATVSGTPGTDGTTGTSAASANGANWQAEVVRSVTGLQEVCVDFDVAQDSADAGERIRWDVRFDAAAFSTAFDLDFTAWESAGTTYQYNRNVCVPVPMGAATVRWRLRMDSNNRRIWVDNVVMSGIAAPYTIPTNGGPDPMDSAAGWTFAGGSAPYVGMNGGSNAMFANVETFTATRAAINATACDVLDVDFDFGFGGTPDTGDDIRLEVSVDAAAFTTVEYVDLNAGVWNVNAALLPWLGLRRVTSSVPRAAGAASVVFRFTLRSDDGTDRVWVDNFEVRCADLATPTVGAVTDTGGGMYSVSLSTALPEDVSLRCTWQTTNDGPLTSTSVETFYP